MFVGDEESSSEDSGKSDGDKSGIDIAGHSRFWRTQFNIIAHNNPSYQKRLKSGFFQPFLALQVSCRGIAYFRFLLNKLK